MGILRILIFSINAVRNAFYQIALHYSTPLWREYIGVVSQHTKIFNGNVGENICLGNFAEEREAIVNFCKEYGFDLYFKSLPQGLDTLLGEDGINISGGQQQLIAFARALYRKEPTNLPFS